MFSSYRINEKRDSLIHLSLVFKKGEINFYACVIKYLEGDVNTHYDFSTDVTNDEWNPIKAKAKLKVIPETLICDALLKQLFLGSRQHY